MTPKGTPILVAAFLLAFLVSSALAVEGGNTSKGRKLYRQFCLGCHTDFSAAGQLNTRSKTQSQWKRFFKKNKHEDQTRTFAGLSDEELLNIRRYLHDYAADTDASRCGSCWENN
jgi:hypothetical protein